MRLSLLSLPVLALLLGCSVDRDEVSASEASITSACADYVSTSLAQLGEHASRGCTESGPAWEGDPVALGRWCRGVPTSTAKRMLDTRSAILASCAPTIAPTAESTCRSWAIWSAWHAEKNHALECWLEDDGPEWSRSEEDRHAYCVRHLGHDAEHLVKSLAEAQEQAIAACLDDEGPIYSR